MNAPLSKPVPASYRRLAYTATLVMSLGLIQPAWGAFSVNAGNGTVTDSTTSLV